MWWKLLEHVFSFSKRRRYKGSGVPRPADPPPLGPRRPEWPSLTPEWNEQISQESAWVNPATCAAAHCGAGVRQLRCCLALDSPAHNQGFSCRFCWRGGEEGLVLCLGHQRMPNLHNSINSNLQGTRLVALAHHTFKSSPTGFKFFKIRRKKYIIQTGLYSPLYQCSHTM